MVVGLSCNYIYTVFFFQPLIPMKVYKEIMSLHDNKAQGPENILSKYIKIASEFIATTLSDLFNTFVIEGKFPSQLKLAKVKLIHKSGPTELPTNHRRISILSPFAKIFEKLINKSLNEYFPDNNLITNQQFGFRKGHSTSTLITDVISQLKLQKEKKRNGCIILLDLKIAFNTVNHKILLSKRQKYGISGNIFSFFESYFNQRKQYVFHILHPKLQQ